MWLLHLVTASLSIPQMGDKEEKRLQSVYSGLNIAQFFGVAMPVLDTALISNQCKLNFSSNVAYLVGRSANGISAKGLLPTDPRKISA